MLLIICVFKFISGSILPVILSITEVILFLLIFTFTLNKFSLVLLSKEWIKTHFSFGYRSFMGGMVAELNTRVDVLLLGYFVSDSIVGIYSLAAMIAEGFYQLLVVFRTNLNPILARLLSIMDTKEIITIKQRIFKIIYPLMAFGGILLAILYPLVCNIFMGEIYLTGWVPLGILTGSIILVSGYVAYGNILSQAGYPGRETIITISTVVINFGMNLALIPYCGMIGAAVATGTSFIANALFLKYWVKRVLDISI